MTKEQKQIAQILDARYMNIECSILSARRYLKENDNDFKDNSYQILNEQIKKELKAIDEILNHINKQ